MLTVQSILADLKKKGREKTRQIYANHGNDQDRCFGVSMADLKVMAKTLRGQHTLAGELYGTGMLEAMYLAAMVSDGSQMSRAQLQAWAESAADLQMVSEYAVPWLAVENSAGRELALEWMKSKKERVAATGWCTYAGLLATREDQSLDFAEIERLLQIVQKEILRAQNRVRYTMNVFVISVGSYVKPLLKQAKSVAKASGEVSVDVGKTACQVPSASAYIANIEAMGRLGKKRKTMRC